MFQILVVRLEGIPGSMESLAWVVLPGLEFAVPVRHPVWSVSFFSVGLWYP